MNDAIAKSRQIALQILQPTAKDLEHGLELHREAIVCESYGFAPRAAVDGEALAAAIDAGASGAEISELVNEMYSTRFATDPEERAQFTDALQEAGVTCILQNAGVESQDPQQVIKRLAYFTYAVDMMPEVFVRGRTPADIEQAKKEGKYCLYLNSCAVPLTQRWESVTDELSQIRLFFQLGIRMMHLTYNRRNMIGDGCAESSNCGLSDFGRAVVAEMNKVGVIVDVAHSGWQTSLEAAQISRKPVVASHSGCSALSSHFRCKPDDVIRAIADTGGYVGICCIPKFLEGTGDIQAFLNHIDHIVKHFGPEYVAIGTDVAYVSTNWSEQRNKAPRSPRRRPAWEDFWPAGTAWNDPAWWKQSLVRSMAWTNWPLFTVGLVQRGYSDEDIMKIIGGNVLRVVKAALA